MKANNNHTPDPARSTAAKKAWRKMKSRPDWKVRTAWLKLPYVQIGKPLEIWAYTRDEEYVGRLMITHAGVAAFSGNTGKMMLCDLNWEKFFMVLARHGRSRQ